MKIRILSLSILLFSITAYSQKGITFSVEKLSKPDKYLSMQSDKDIYEKLILSDVNMHPAQVKKEKVDSLDKIGLKLSNVDLYQIKKEGVDFPFNIVTKSQLPDSLVSFGYHSFFNGMYQAYADHRPFVLSPDMIWLLISQEFAQHVNANPEELRHYFVNFSGKLSLIVATDEIILDNPESPWEKVFPEFTRQIAEHTGSELINLLSSDFTTTTPVEKIASEITIMKTMEPYFEFIIIRMVCGIPEITLQGTTEDWQKVLDKTKALEKYDLAWWTKELEPILEEFVKVSKGEVKKNFWRNMFKYHSQSKYGAPNIIDGWIVKFFPYDKNGKRNNLKELEGDKNLPEEIVKVDLKFIDTVTDITTPLELWAGFVGLEQNKKNYALTPKVGWMIRKKDVNNVGLKQKLELDNNSKWGGRISIRVKEIPSAIFELEEIKSLEIVFIDKIVIPEELAKVKIGKLILSGKIDKPEAERIRQLFPDTEVIINGNMPII